MHIFFGMIVDCSNKYSVIDRYDHKVHTDYDVTADKKGGGGAQKKNGGTERCVHLENQQAKREMTAVTW